MKIHLFLAAAVGLAITVTASHAAPRRSLDETIQHYGRPTKGPKEINLRRDYQGVGTVVQLMESNIPSRCAVSLTLL